MGTKITVKRGTTTQCDAITPDAGEPLWDTTASSLRIGDGSTAGGIVIGPTWPADQHGELKTTSDNKQIRINHRAYTQTSGDSIGFMSKPSQEATTTGEVFGVQISPRIQSSYGALSLVGIGINCDLKGAAGGNVTHLRGISLELESASGSTRTITNVCALRARNYLHGTVTNGPFVMLLEAAEGNVAWGGFLKAAASGAGGVTVGSDGMFKDPETHTEAGYILIDIAGTEYEIPFYAKA